MNRLYSKYVTEQFDSVALGISWIPLRRGACQACVCLAAPSCQGKSDAVAGIKMTSNCHGSVNENRAELKLPKASITSVGYTYGELQVKYRQAKLSRYRGQFSSVEYCCTLIKTKTSSLYLVLLFIVSLDPNPVTYRQPYPS